MPTIRKRGDTWQAQVRRAGYPSVAKSFETKADAVAWAREKERAIDRAELPANTRELKRLTVADLIRRYEKEITPRKRGAAFERSRIRTLLAHKMAKTSLNNLSGGIVAQYRDDRLKLVKPASVRRELVILRHVFEVARREWDLPIRENPFARLRLPKDSQPRERRIPLTPTALATLAAVRKTSLHERVFPITANSIRLAWERLRRRAGLPDLRMHDLRHEAVSRFFELGLSVPEVALISGHKEPRMLTRYTHLDPQLVALKLDAR